MNGVTAHEHDETTRSLAAYVLGALDAEERGAVERHLAWCERCRDDLAQLAPIPGLLAHVDARDLERARVDVADAAVAAARRDLTRLARSRRWWRLAAAAAIVVAVALGAVAFWPDEGSDAVALSASSELGLESWASATPRSWGTELAIGCDEIPDSSRYVLVAIARDGRQEQAAAWGPSDEYHVVVEGATSIPLDELDRVVVLDATGRELFRASS